MINVLIIDDHAIVREGWKQILAETEDIRITGEAGDTHEGMQKIREGKWDLIILDLTLPGSSGLDFLKEVKRMHPELPVLICSMHPEEQYAVRVLKADAAGYIQKDTAPNELVNAIRKAYAGGKYVSPSLGEHMAILLNQDSEGLPHERLTDREFQVLCFLAAGKATGDIASTLHLSPKTISTFRARILEKMQMSNNAELIRYALKHDLVD